MLYYKDKKVLLFAFFYSQYSQLASTLLGLHCHHWLLYKWEGG